MVHKNVFLFLFLFGFARLTNAETIRYYMFDLDDIIKLLPSLKMISSKAVPLNAKPMPLIAKPVQSDAKPMQLNANSVPLSAKPLPLSAKPLPLSAKPLPLNAISVDPRAHDNSPEIDTIMYDYDYDSYFRKKKPQKSIVPSSFEYQDCISKYPLRYCTEEIDFISHRADPYPEKEGQVEEGEKKPEECKVEEEEKDVCKIKEPEKDICQEKKPESEECKIKETKTESKKNEAKKPSTDECEVKQPQNDICEVKEVKPSSDTDVCKIEPPPDECKPRPEQDVCKVKPDSAECKDKTVRISQKIIDRNSQRKFSTDYVDVNDLMRAKEHKKEAYKQIVPEGGVTVKVIKGKNLLNRIERALETAKGDTDFLEKIVSMFVPSASASQPYNLRRGPNSAESDSSSSESIELRPATIDKKKPSMKKKKLKLRPGKGSEKAEGLAVPIPEYQAPEEVPAVPMPVAPSESAQLKPKHRQKHDMKKKLKRFQVVSSLKNILNNMASDESLSQENFINDIDSSKDISLVETEPTVVADEASGDVSVPLSEESTTMKPKLSKVPAHRKPATYMQGLKRIYKEGKDFRKRLETFLPKRYMWAPSEFKHLGYFWFNGPQGYHPGIWKVVT